MARYLKLIMVMVIGLILIGCDKPSKKQDSSENEKSNVTALEMSSDENVSSEVNASNSDEVSETNNTVSNENKADDTEELSKNSIDTTSCTSCHGNNFEKKALGKSKIVANMTKQEVSDALVGYKNNTYGGEMKTLMQIKVKDYSEEALRHSGIGK